MKTLLLYGIKCQPWIWEPALKFLPQADITVVEYPRQVTRQCRSLAQLASWVFDTYLRGGSFDCIAGHSMGGILAVMCSVRPEIHLKQTIWMDCFLRDTGVFFQNLLMESAPVDLRQRVKKMLAEENEEYSAEIKQELRETQEDFVAMAQRIPHSLACIYGDRGEPDHVRTQAELLLPPALLSRLHIQWTPNACHFPMLENPAIFAGQMKNLIEMTQ